MPRENEGAEPELFEGDVAARVETDEVPAEFVRWWSPIKTDPEMGSIGGHDHCPKHMRNLEGRWGWSSGITAAKAWLCECYRREFREARARGIVHAEPGTGVFYGLYNSHKPPPDTDPAEYEAFTLGKFDMGKVVEVLRNKFDMNRVLKSKETTSPDQEARDKAWRESNPPKREEDPF